jgi:hypothetical protein
MAELKKAAALAGKTIQVKLSQLDTAWEVRIRQRSYKPVNITAGPLAAAEKLVKKVESYREHGPVIGYTKAHHVMFTQLMLMHIDKHKRPKSFGHDFYKVASWLRDSGKQGEELLERFQAARDDDKPLPSLKFRMAEAMESPSSGFTRSSPTSRPRTSATTSTPGSIRSGRPLWTVKSTSSASSSTRRPEAGATTSRISAASVFSMGTNDAVRRRRGLGGVRHLKLQV